uniref:Uncharacterized protein n=1 Tax=Gopherus evgoodei TaxID=1825980 RepID=A0A8C4VNH3_9SAUR
LHSEGLLKGFKFSADVKPFVPKYTTVTVAWSEPSEACVFPTTYYPRVQEQSVDKYMWCLALEEIASSPGVEG